MNRPTEGHDGSSWPVAKLDPVRRLRALAAGTPGGVVAEGIIPAPFEAVWEIASDLENEVPRSEWHVRSLRITSREGDRLGGAGTWTHGCPRPFRHRAAAGMVLDAGARAPCGNGGRPGRGRHPFRIRRRTARSGLRCAASRAAAREPTARSGA